MNEFCPKCLYPIQASKDQASKDRERLCETCGWFGDKIETLAEPTESGDFNPTRAAAQILGLFRDVCRQELILEQACDAGIAAESHMKRVRIIRQAAIQNIIGLFVRLRESPTRRRKKMLKMLKKDPKNGLLPWPDSWTDYHYNACAESCDMLIGPCSCGAWHSESEEWVKQKLQEHGVYIE
jgi:hypothetical protein